MVPQEPSPNQEASPCVTPCSGTARAFPISRGFALRDTIAADRFSTTRQVSGHGLSRSSSSLLVLSPALHGGRCQAIASVCRNSSLTLSTYFPLEGRCQAITFVVDHHQLPQRHPLFTKVTGMPEKGPVDQVKQRLRWKES